MNFSKKVNNLTIYDILETDKTDNTEIGLSAVDALEANIYEHLIQQLIRQRADDEETLKEMLKNVQNILHL